MIMGSQSCSQIQVKVPGRFVVSSAIISDQMRGSVLQELNSTTSDGDVNIEWNTWKSKWNYHQRGGGGAFKFQGDLSELRGA